MPTKNDKNLQIFKSYLEKYKISKDSVNKLLNDEKFLKICNFP